MIHRSLTIIAGIVAIPIGIGLMYGSPIQVQSPVAAPSLAFDVVSIKPDVPGFGPGSLISFACRGTDGTDPPRRVAPMGMCVGSRASAEMLLASAYDINPAVKGALVAEPDWFNQDRYALQAKSENIPTLQELRTMLQTMLADQFKLRCHIEMRDVDGFALVVGRNGPKFKEASGQEDPAGNSFGLRLKAGAGGAPPTVISSSLHVVNLPMDEVARLLASQLHKPVINKTNLSGKYNINLLGYGPPDDPNSSSPSLSSTIEDVELKLEAQKVSISVLVIDHAEKPKLN